MVRAGKKRGRPPLPPSEGKRANFTTRLSDNLKRRLEEAAQAGGYSLSEEIERRLERTFLLDDGLGGPRTAAVLRGLAAFAQRLGYSDDWVTDGATYHEVISKLHEYLKASGPDLVILGPNPAIVEAKPSPLRQETLDQAKQYVEFLQTAPDIRNAFVRLILLSVPELPDDLVERLRRHLPAASPRKTADA